MVPEILPDSEPETAFLMLKIKGKEARELHVKAHCPLFRAIWAFFRGISQWKVFSFSFFHLDEKGGGGGDRFSLSRSFDLCFLFVFWRIAGWKIGPRGNSGESSKRRKKKRLGQVG